MLALRSRRDWTAGEIIVVIRWELVRLVWRCWYLECGLVLVCDALVSCLRDCVVLCRVVLVSRRAMLDVRAGIYIIHGRHHATGV